MFLWQTTAKLLGTAQEPQAALMLPDADNEAEVRRFQGKLAALLRDEQWPETVDFRKAVEALVDFTETRPGFVQQYFPDSWAEVIAHATRVDGCLQSLFYTTLNCLSAISETQFPSLVPLLWHCLESKDAIVRYQALQLLLAICTKARSAVLNSIATDPTVLLVLVDLIRSEVDFLRNEAVLFIKELCAKDEEMQKSLAFQGIFEAVAEIMEKEEGVVVADCLSLVTALASDFTRNYIREVPSFLKAVKTLLARWKPAEDVIALIGLLLKDSRGDVIRNNQLSFSSLLPDLVLLAFPTLPHIAQVPRAVSLLTDFLHGNRSQQRDLPLLLLPAGSDFVSFFDALLSHCVMQPEPLNWSLVALLASDPDLQTQLISKITAVLGTATDDCIPPFNSRLIDALDTGKRLDEVCSLLEMLLADNDVSKELASSLPISSASQTLLHRLCDLLSASIAHRTVESCLPVLRLLSVWVFHHPPSAHTLYSRLIAAVPEMVEMCTEDAPHSSAVAVLLAVLIDSLQEKAELGKIVLGKVGLPAFASKLEVYFNSPETGKHLKQGIKPPGVNFFTQAFVHVYRDVVPAAKKHLVRQMSGVTSGREQELAKLIQVQEQIIEDLQSQMRMKKSLGLLGPETSEEEGVWKRRAETCEREVLELRLKLQEVEARSYREVVTAKQEAQGAVDAYLHSQERLSELEDRVRRLHQDNELLRSAVHASAGPLSSQLFKLSLEKDSAEREAAELRAEIASLRTALRKIAGGRRGGSESRTEEVLGDAKVELVFAQTVGSEEEVESDHREEENSEFTTGLTEEVMQLQAIPPAVVIEKPVEAQPPRTEIPAVTIVEPETHTLKPLEIVIEKPPEASIRVPDHLSTRPRLFLESPSFPDIASFIEETVSPATQSLLQASAEEPPPTESVPNTHEKAVGKTAEKVIEEVQEAPTNASAADFDMETVIPEPPPPAATHPIDPISFFDQASSKSEKSSQRINPFAF